MIDANQCREQLASLLRQQIDCTVATDSYLSELRQAIAENRLADLNQSIMQPQTSLQKTDELERQRRSLMESYGFSVDRAGLEHCISWCDDDSGTLHQLHLELLEKLTGLERSLQVSNLLVNKGKQGIAKALEVLTQQPATAKTYTASGTTQSGSTLKRTIARA